MASSATPRTGRPVIKRGTGKRRVDGRNFRLADEIRYIQRRAADHDGRLVTLGQLVLFSTQTGDAWLLDRSDHLATRIARIPPNRSTRLRLHRSRYRPHLHRTRISDRKAHSPRMSPKFQICLARIYRLIQKEVGSVSAALPPIHEVMGRAAE